MTRTIPHCAIAIVLAAAPISVRAAAPAAEPPGPRASDTPAAPAPATGETAPEISPIEPADDGVGWDDPPPQPLAVPAPTPPPPAVAPAPQQPTEAHRATRRTGTGLLIGAGVVAVVATALNGVRAYIVNVPCQTDSQVGCTGGWMIATPFTWALNLTSIPLAATGGSLRGRYAATYDPDRHAGRGPAFIAGGAVMVVIGVLGNIALRSVWFYDYLHPAGREVFDFAYPGDALGYYGGLQLTSSMIAAGAGMLTYASAGPFKPAKTAMRLRFGVSPQGFSLGGRF